eukprot:m.161192 g.161192  ORF g.161192 m.161192 type:complete len:288 (-) comp16519_c0_seq1:68-931(-)
MPKFNTRNPAVKRIMKEAKELSEPTYDFYAAPLEEDLFEWHFTIRGPSDTEYDGGVYHGRIILPAEYPLKPPSIILLTPNGRFETNKKICLSMSDYHPETWQPSWSIRTVLVALISFFPTKGQGAVGALDCSEDVCKSLASKSRSFRCDTCNCLPSTLLKPEPDQGASDEMKTLASELLAAHNPSPSASAAEVPAADASETTPAATNTRTQPASQQVTSTPTPSRPIEMRHRRQAPQVTATRPSSEPDRPSHVMAVPPNDHAYNVLVFALLFAIAALLYKIMLKNSS